MPKISALPPAGSLSDDDETPFVDDSAGETKKFSLAGLLAWLQSKAVWITASMIAGIDKSILTTDSNPYKFRAYRSSAWTMTNGAAAKLQCNTENFDTNNNYDATTNYRYTAPVDGFYQFNAAITAAFDVGDIYRIHLYKNGAAVSSGNAIVVSSTFGQTLTVSDFIQLSAGDYVEVYYVNGAAAGVAGSTGVANTFFGGFLVSRT